MSKILEQFTNRLIEWLKRAEQNAYRVSAMYRAKNKISDEFGNDDWDDAEVLASVMIGECSEEDSVRIYSGTLDMNNNCKCYKEALERSQAGSIRVLLDGINDDNISGLVWLKKVPAYKKGALEVRIIKNMEGIASKEGMQVPEGHFFFTSRNAYRKETDHIKVAARANFYDPGEVEKLSRLFNNIWFKLGVPVDLKEIGKDS